MKGSYQVGSAHHALSVLIELLFRKLHQRRELARLIVILAGLWLGGALEGGLPFSLVSNVRRGLTTSWRSLLHLLRRGSNPVGSSRVPNVLLIIYTSIILRRKASRTAMHTFRSLHKANGSRFAGFCSMFASAS